MHGRVRHSLYIMKWMIIYNRSERPAPSAINGYGQDQTTVNGSMIAFLQPPDGLFKAALLVAASDSENTT